MSLPPSQASPTSPEPRPERVRAGRAKKAIIEYLTKCPIVEAACKKVGISRSTHYEWCKRDLAYRVKVEEALGQGVDIVNDVAESNLIANVKNGDLGVTKYWLEHHHPAYRKHPVEPRVETLFLKPKPSAQYIAMMKKYNPNYKPSTRDQYMTEKEWKLEQERALKASDAINERLRDLRFSGSTLEEDGDETDE